MGDEAGFVEVGGGDDDAFFAFFVEGFVSSSLPSGLLRFLPEEGDGFEGTSSGLISTTSSSAVPTSWAVTLASTSSALAFPFAGEGFGGVEVGLEGLLAACLAKKDDMLPLRCSTGWRDQSEHHRGRLSDEVLEGTLIKSGLWFPTFPTSFGTG